MEKQFKDGTYYGDLQEGKKHGKGKMIYLSKKVYEGEWKNGKRDGYGKMTYANGDVYEGEWKNNKRNGQGTLTSKSGIEENGTWVEDQIQESSKRLNEEALQTLNKEYMALTETIKGYMPEISVIKSFIGYFDIADDYEMKKNIRLFILCAIKNGNNNSNPGYVNSIFKECESNGELFNQLIDTIFQDTEAAREVFYKYFDERMSISKNLNDIIKEIKFWIKTYENILYDDYFFEKSIMLLSDYMGNSKNKIHDNKIMIANFNFEKDFSQEINTRLKVYTDKIKKQFDIILLNSINLNTISKEEILNIQFSREYISKGFRIIKAAKEIFSATAMDVNTIKKSITYLESDETDFKVLLRRLLQKDIRNENFYKIVYAFEIGNAYEFDKVLSYIKLAGKQEIYNFLEWVFENKIFFSLVDYSQQKYFVNTKFIEAVKKYFINEDKEAIRNRELRRRFKKYPNLDKIMIELEYETSSDAYKKLKKAPKTLMKSAESINKIPKELSKFPKSLMNILKIVFKPVTKGQIIWLVLFAIAYYAIYKTELWNELYTIDYVGPALGCIFYGVGPGIILNNFLAPVFVVFTNYMAYGSDIFSYSYIQRSLIIVIAANFIAGILANLIGRYCKKNKIKYAFTVLTAILGVYFISLLLNINYVFSFEFGQIFTLFLNSYNIFDINFDISLLAGCTVIFVIKKIKKEY